MNIVQLYLYPCRGVKEILVDRLKVSNYGVKYDREWTFIDGVSHKIPNPGEAKLSMLRQRFERD